MKIPKPKINLGTKNFIRTNLINKMRFESKKVAAMGEEGVRVGREKMEVKRGGG